MKRYISIALYLLLLNTPSFSQQIEAYAQSSSGIIDGYTLPQTVINITITVRREVTMRGPYAKYASQYLGIIGVPQTDKQTYSIMGATINYHNEPNHTQTFMLNPKSEQIPDRIFKWLPLDEQPYNQDIVAKDSKYMDAQLTGQNPFEDVGSTIFQGASHNVKLQRNSIVAKTIKQMAEESATTIFKLRKKRIELILAEQGENVFGAGLDAALKEISRLETEYLMLFVGKQFSQITTKSFTLLPKRGQNRTVICRFSNKQGLVSAMNMAAEPIIIEINTDTHIKAQTIVDHKARKIKMLIPIITNTKISYQEQELAQKRVPVYQLGATIEVPII